MTFKTQQNIGRCGTVFTSSLEKQQLFIENTWCLDNIKFFLIKQCRKGVPAAEKLPVLLILSTPDGWLGDHGQQNSQTIQTTGKRK